jgi:hypothetical protein
MSPEPLRNSHSLLLGLRFIAQLPKAKQRFVMEMLETVLAQASR